MFLYLKMILSGPYDEMDKMQRVNDGNIVRYVFGDLADYILTQFNLSTNLIFRLMIPMGLFQETFFKYN